MKSSISLIFLLVLVITSTGAAGQSPQVPHKMTFAGISLTIHDDARAEIQKDVDALTKSPKYYEIKAERAKSYFPIIEKIFKEENIPDEMKYLVLQESALIPDAVSSSNAVGFWQFKEATAQEFGLVVNGTVDDRMNIVHATRGAARYFKKSNTFFNNWILVIQSYQMGIGGTQRSTGEKFNGLRHMDINASTYWYVKKFLAHLIAFGQLKIENPKTVLSTITLSKGATLNELAERSGVPVQQVQDYNKWAKTGVIPGDRAYAVIIPSAGLSVEKIEAVANSGKSPSPKNTASEVLFVNGLKAVKAGSGEQLAALAARCGVKLSRFLKWNEIDKSHKPSAGQIYYLQAKSGSGERGVFTSSGKENLWAVSQLTGVRYSAIRKWNPDLGEGPIKAGLVVRLSPENGVPKRAKSIGVDSRKPFEWTSGQ